MQMKKVAPVVVLVLGVLIGLQAYSQSGTESFLRRSGIQQPLDLKSYPSAFFPPWMKIGKTAKTNTALVVFRDQQNGRLPTVAGLEGAPDVKALKVLSVDNSGNHLLFELENSACLVVEARGGRLIETTLSFYSAPGNCHLALNPETQYNTLRFSTILKVAPPTLADNPANGPTHRKLLGGTPDFGDNSEIIPTFMLDDNCRCMNGTGSCSMSDCMNQGSCTGDLEHYCDDDESVIPAVTIVHVEIANRRLL